MVYLFLFTIGICWGSFVHVIAYRVPVGKYWKNSRSQCKNCEHLLGIFDLIPLVSFLCQSGKCRYCLSRISLIYPVTEFLTGIMFIICYMQSKDCLFFVLLILIASTLEVLAISDFYYLRLPNYFLVFLLFLECIFAYQMNFIFINHLFFALVVLGIFLALSFLVKQGIGMGDIKLLVILSLIFSVTEFLWLIIASCISALIIIFILTIANKQIYKEKIPFGPFLCTWAFIFLIIGQ